MSAPRDVAKLLSGSMLARAFGVVSTMLFARILTKEQMAIFPAYLMLAGLPLLVLTFGIYAAFVREIPSLLRTDEAKARSLVLAGSGIIVAGTIVPCLACWWWSDAISVFVFKTAAMGWAIRVMVPGFAAYVVFKTADQVMWGMGKFGTISTIQILESVVRPAATIGLYLCIGYPGIVLGLVIAQAIVAAISLWCVRSMYFRRFPGIYPLRKLISESMPYYVGNYLSYLRGDGDSILVTAFLGPAALAEYYVAKTLFSNMALVWTAVDRVAVQRLARAVGTSKFVAKLNELHVRIANILVPFAFFAIALAPGALVVLAGARYASAQWPATVLLLASLMMFVAIPFDRGVYVSLPGIVRLKFTVMEAVVTIATAAALVPVLGIVGVAAARIAAPTGVRLFGAHILRKRLGIVLSAKPTLLALATTAPGAALALLLTPAAHGIFSALSAMATGAAIWATSSFVLAFVFNRSLLDTLIQAFGSRWRAAFILR